MGRLTSAPASPALIRLRARRYRGPESMYEYDLFSVVCHEGQIDNGHYTCFTRHQDEVRLISSAQRFDVKHPTDPAAPRSGTGTMTKSASLREVYHCAC